jgi:hypothetical protein
MVRFVLCIAAALALIPLMAGAECGDGNCAVGALGTGGQASGGQAQGSHFEGPGAIPGATITNSGNADAGRLQVSFGSISGTFRDGTARGRGTGVFGDWAGQCEDPFGDPDGC